VIVTGVVGAPIARADIGADPGVPSPAGVAAAVVDAVGVPGVTPAENPVAVALPAPESLPTVAQAADAALQATLPTQATPPVVPSQAEQPPVSVAASPARPSASPTDPSTEGAPGPESPIPAARADDSAAAPDPRGEATPAGETAGDITAAEPATREQPAAISLPAASQVGPVNIQVSIRVASPGDNGAVTQVNAVVTATSDNAAPGPGDRADYADTVGNPAGPSDIGRDITGGTGDGSTNASASHPTCDPDSRCCTISLLAGVCLDADAGGLSPQDLVRILGAVFENASDNSGIAAQYQGDPVQYRPINISVSIRISSPGNDGPVVQTNLVHVQASFSVDVGQALQSLPGFLDTTLPGSFDATIEVAPVPADGDVGAPEPAAGEGENGTGAVAPADIEGSGPNFPRPAVLDSPFPLSTGPVSRSLNAISLLAWSVGRPPSVAWIAPLAAPGTDSADTARPAATNPGQRRRTRAAAPTAPPAHPWVPVAFSVAPASASSSGGGSVVGSRSRSRCRSCSPFSLPASDGSAHPPACRPPTSTGSPSGPGERGVLIPTRGVRSGFFELRKEER
jgi:hypothetical protein